MLSRYASLASLLAIVSTPVTSWIIVGPGTAAVPSSVSTRHPASQSTRRSPWVDRDALLLRCPAVAGSRFRRGLGVLRMGKEEEAIEEEVRTMRASKIKQALEEMSVETKGVYEKEGLVQMLVTEKVRTLSEPQHEASSSPPPPPPPPTSSGERGDKPNQPGTPPTKSWTEAKFGGGGGLKNRVARVTAEGTVVPMTRIRPSETVLGDGISVDQKDYYCIEVDLPNTPKGPTTELFMLDTAATSSLLTPRANARLGAVKTGVSAMGAAGTDSVSGMYQVSLGEAKVAGQSFGQLKAVVMELPITDIKGKGSEGMEKGVSGILGMDFLARFDVKLDFQSGDATFAKPGVAASGGLGSSEMTGIPGRTLPTGFMVIDVQMKPTEEARGSPSGIPAIVDLGSAFTIANWPAGRLTGLEPHGRHVRYTGQASRFEAVVAGAAAPGEVYRPVEVGEANMDMLIGARKDLGQSAGNRNMIRSRVVMFADLPGFKAMGLTGPTIILGSDVLKLGKGAMIISFFSKKIWLAL
ncbi:unnamed protein product [Pylaiella littoralis]